MREKKTLTIIPVVFSRNNAEKNVSFSASARAIYNYFRSACGHWRSRGIIYCKESKSQDVSILNKIGVWFFFSGFESCGPSV